MNKHPHKDHPKAEIFILFSGGFWCAVVLLILLSGCTTTGQVLDNTDQWRADTVSNLVRINDRFLEDAEVMLCQGASKGALDRRYGTSTETAAAYNAFCNAAQSGKILIGADDGQ